MAGSNSTSEQIKKIYLDDNAEVLELEKKLDKSSNKDSLIKLAAAVIGAGLGVLASLLLPFPEPNTVVRSIALAVIGLTAGVTLIAAFRLTHTDEHNLRVAKEHLQISKKALIELQLGVKVVNFVEAEYSETKDIFEKVVISKYKIEEEIEVCFTPEGNVLKKSKETITVEN